MSALPDLPHLEITSAEALWAWLGLNHDQGAQLLVTWKAAHRDKYVSREAVLDALVAHGWVDGRRWTHDDPARTIQLIAPRAQQIWAQSYKTRAARLMDAGRMHASGRAAYEAAQRSPDWTASDPVDALEVPEDLQTALSAASGAAWFETAAPSYKRNVLRYLAGAKRAETRAKRVRQIADHAANGEKLPNY